MTTYIYKYDATNDVERDHLINRLDTDAMIEFNNSTYYGGKADNRAEGYAVFFATDEEGHFTEETPAVLWVSTFPHNVTDWEDNFKPQGLTFPQYVQGLYNLQREVELSLLDSRVTNYESILDNVATGEVAGMRQEHVDGILQAFYGDTSVADTLSRIVVECALSIGRSKAFGPYINKKAGGIMNSSPAQLLADMTGLIDYTREGTTKRHGVQKELPAADGDGIFTTESGRKVRVHAINKEWDKKASKSLNFPSKAGALSKNPEAMSRLVMAARTAIAQAIAVYAADTKANEGATFVEEYKTGYKSRIEFIGQSLAKLTHKLIAEAGLPPKLLEQLDGRRKKVDSRHAVALVEDNFWSYYFGVDGAPDGTFWGAYDGLAAVFSGIVTRVLAADDDLANYVSEDTPRLETVALGEVLEGGSVQKVHTLHVRDDLWERVSRHVGNRLVSRSNWSAHQYFPSLPMAGECGGNISAKPSNNRSNSLIKHSRRGTPQERAASAGSRCLVAVERMQRTACAPIEGESLLDVIDDNLL